MMRWSISIILIGFALSVCVYAANEISAIAPGVSTAYSIIRKSNGDAWYPTGQVWESWGTSGRTAADYDIALTDKKGGMFVGDFDTNISSGYYTVVTYYQAGGSPDDDDPAVWSDYGYWDGTSWSKDHSQAVTDLLVLLDTTVSDANDANNFTLTAGSTDPNAYQGMLAYVQDADTGLWDAQLIIKWTAGRVVTTDRNYAFTPAIADRVIIWGLWYFPPGIYESLPFQLPPDYYILYNNLLQISETIKGKSRVLNVEGRER